MARGVAWMIGHGDLSDADDLAEKCEAAFLRGLAIGCSIGFGVLIFAIIYNFLFSECL